MALIITDRLKLGDEEFEWKFIRSPGPGGQNVNKVASAVQLRFLLQSNSSLEAQVKHRLRGLAGRRLNEDGSILITARTGRSQEQNKREALTRLESMLRAALIEPKRRKKTRPTRASQQRRIDGKKHRGGLKQRRQTKAWD
jgi:ribosome-associated protein